MGDFNATFHEKVFRTLCPPLRETLPTSRRALMHPVGTYYFRQQWSYLDHILVSEALLSWQEGIGHTPTAGELRLPFLLKEDGSPHRTFLGNFYNGGISDHLPLYLDLHYLWEP